MRNRFLLILISLAFVAGVVSPQSKTGRTVKDYPILSVPFTKVVPSDGFWKHRIDVNRTATLPHAFRQSETTGRVANFSIAGGLAKGKFCGYQFNDSDVFKIIEGASYELALSHNATLEHYVDSLIQQIASAQEADGYLYTARKLMSAEYSPPGGKDRWVGEKDGSHELYNAGHLYEAGVAHFNATGKRTLLDVAIRNADLVCKTFGPVGRKEVPGHEEIEIGLCKLYRLTGEDKYLKTAKFFLDERGDSAGHELIGEYAQDHKPVLKQDKAVGHAVRAMYLYSGMLDVAMLTGNRKYAAAVDKLWSDVTGTKMYVTGGIGQTGSNEGFGKPYDLPNKNAYCETCASIAYMLWNDRMFRMYGDAKYYDVLERTLYNSFLSGTSLTGDKFFYPNPLSSFSGAERSPWFNCACCPSNIVRFVPTIPGYAYAHKRDSVFVNLYMAGSAIIPVGDTSIIVTQETRYPYDGNVTLKIATLKALPMTMLVRIPGWAENTASPEVLYNFLDSLNEKTHLSVNGTDVPLHVRKGYAAIQRTWRDGDSVTVEFPMPVRRVLPDSRIIANLGRISLQRGPLMYCAEGIDNAGSVLPLVITDAAQMMPKFRPDLFGGIEVIESKAYPMQRQLNGPVASGDMQPFTAIPYFAWANRGRSPMTVWFASSPRVAYPQPAQTLAFASSVTASGGAGIEALNDQILPANSDDESVPLFHWWPKKGTEEWVQYEFKSKARVSTMKVYWFDDTGVGECRVPKSWQAEYRVNGEWKPVAGASYAMEKDQENMITFAPVETDAVRVLVTSQPEFSSGMYEWVVE